MKDIPTKERILDAAEKLFVDNGFSATSLRAIIKEADVNTAAVHYHFGSKEGLVEAVFARRMGDLNRERLDMLAGFQAQHLIECNEISWMMERGCPPTIIYKIIKETDTNKGQKRAGNSVRCHGQTRGRSTRDLSAGPANQTEDLHRRILGPILNELR